LVKRSPSLLAVAALTLVLAHALPAGAQLPPDAKGSDRKTLLSPKSPGAGDERKALEERAGNGEASAQFQLAGILESEGQQADAVKWYFAAALQHESRAIAPLQRLVAPLVPLPPRQPVGAVAATAPADAAGTARSSVTGAHEGRNGDLHDDSLPSSTAFEAMGMAALALLVSTAALIVSWWQTRRTLRAAGLL
jgi:hypothetical protein